MDAECNNQDKLRYQRSVEKIFSLILNELRIDMNQIAYDLVNNKSDPTIRLHDLVSEKYAWVQWVPIAGRYNDSQSRHFLAEKMHIGKVKANKDTFEQVVPIEIIINGSCHSGKIIFGVMNRYIKERIDSYMLDQDISFIVFDEVYDPIFLYNDDKGEGFLFVANDHRHEFFRFTEYPLFLYSSDHYHASNYVRFSVELYLVIVIVVFLHSIIYWMLSNTLKTLSRTLDKKNLPTYTYIHEIDLILVRIRELTQQSIHSKITIQNLLILNEELKVSQESLETTCKRLRHLLEEAIADRDACMIINKAMEDRLRYIKSEKQELALDRAQIVSFICDVFHGLLNKLEENINLINSISSSQNINDKSASVIEVIEHENKMISCFIKNIINLLNIHSGDFALNLEEVDMLSLIDESLQMLIHFSECYKVKVSHAIADNIGRVLLDKTHIQAMLNSLLDHIIKKAEVNFINIKSERVSDVVMIEIVFDGITPVVRDCIFNADKVDEVEILIYIMDKIVCLHNGELTCISNKEYKASIIIKIPIQHS